MVQQGRSVWEDVAQVGAAVAAEHVTIASLHPPTTHTTTTLQCISPTRHILTTSYNIVTFVLLVNNFFQLHGSVIFVNKNEIKTKIKHFRSTKTKSNEGVFKKRKRNKNLNLM